MINKLIEEICQQNYLNFIKIYNFKNNYIFQLKNYSLLNF